MCLRQAHDKGMIFYVFPHDGSTAQLAHVVDGDAIGSTKFYKVCASDRGAGLRNPAPCLWHCSTALCTLDADLTFVLMQSSHIDTTLTLNGPGHWLVLCTIQVAQSMRMVCFRNGRSDVRHPRVCPRQC